MRTGTVVLAALLAAALSTGALAAKKKAGPDPALQAHKDSAAFFHALFHPVSAGDGVTTRKSKGKKS